MTNLTNSKAPSFIQNLTGINKDEEVEIQNSAPSGNPKAPSFLQGINSTTKQIDPKDIEVSNELGFDLEDWWNNKEEVKLYVDSLSDDDYQIWNQLKNEWYSLSARKTLMENRDLLYDISKPWANKYISNKPSLTNTLTNIAQKYNLWYEQTLHPWSESIQDYLDQWSYRLEDKLWKENLMNNWIEKNNPYWNLSPYQAQWRINDFETAANIAQIPKVGWEILLSLWKSWVGAIDQWLNRIGIIWANVANVLNKDNQVQINYGEDRSNLLGSYIQSARDVMWAGLTVSYPIVTYIFSMLWATQTDRNTLMERVDWWFDKVIWKLLELDVIENWMDKNLNEADQEALKEDIKYALYRAGAKLLWWGWKKISRSEAVKNFETVSKMVDNYWKRNAKLEMEKNYNLRKAASQEPIWTEVLNEKGKPIARSTPEWAEFTPYGSADTLIAWGKWYIKWAWEAIASYLKNRGRQILPRDPNTPVWELPEIWINKPVTWETTPPQEEATAVEDVVEETPKVNKKSKTVIKTAEKSTWEWIGSFIKRVTNEISGKEWWLDSTLIEKLKTSKDLQNEYVNTIDPYLKSWWAENPSWVISEQLADLVDSAKIALETKRENNTIFRSWQRKAWVQIPESEKIAQKNEDLQIKELIKLLSRSQDNPELFLEYLMKLPEEKTNYMNQIFPWFTQNLQLIKDTLDITKAITKPDLIDKFLSFKSEWRLRNKGFLKRLFYSYLKEKYKEQGLRANMRELENLINQLSEEELKQRAESMQVEEWEFPEAVNRSIAQITDFEGPRAWKPYKKFIEQWHENLVPKSAIFDQLTYQWYRNEFFMDKANSDKQKTDLKSILHTKYSDWTTPLDWIDFYNIGLDAVNPGFLSFNVAAQSFNNWIIQFRNNLDQFNAWVLWHEIRHQVKWHLTTKELFDFYNNIVKSTKSIKLYEWDSEDFKNISEYMWLEKTRTWIEEYIADSFAQILHKWDLYDLEDFLPPSIWSLDLSQKVNDIFSKVAKDLRDNLSAFETENWKYSTQVWELKKMIDKVRPSKENIKMSKRMYRRRQPSRKLKNGWLRNEMDFERLWLLKNVNPELSNVKFNLDLKSDRLWDLVFEMEDWRQLNWEEFKNTLTEEQRKKFNEDPVLGQEEREEAIKNDEAAVQESLRNPDPLYIKYRDTLRDIDPDIVWLTEKDWKLCVQVLFESYRERYELADRPGMVELKTIPIDEFFVLPEDIKRLPKDLQKLIKKNAD